MGGTLSAPVVSGVLAGCRATPEGAATTNGAAAYAPQTLSAEQYRLTGALADVIIPPTDTPGAREAGVPAFVDQLMTNWYPPEGRKRFTDGLGRVDRGAREVFEAPFVELDPEQQALIVQVLDREAFPNAYGEEPEPEELGDLVAAMESGTYNAQRRRQDQPENDPPDAAPPFMQMLKELVVVGYYTSEIGATEELRVNPMGVWRADIPYAEVGRAWA